MNCPFCIWSHSRSSRVSPQENISTIEIRPARYLRIQHFNARQRDEQLINEMRRYIQLKQLDVSAAASLTEHTKYRNDNYQENVLQQNDVLSQRTPGQMYEHERSQHSNKEITIPSSQDNKDVVIFLFHGVGGSSDIWCAQTKYFADLGYEIVAPDMIGHGFSCTSKDAKAYHFREIAADIEEVFYRYCKKKNILIGHSYGSSFAALLARNHPRYISKLILISGGSPTPLKPHSGVFSLPYCVLACIKPCLFCTFYRGAFYSKRTAVIPRKEAFNISAYVLQHTMNGQKWPDGDELFHQWITCPSLLIYGAQDQLVSLQEEEDMARAIYNSQLEVIEDAGHMVIIEAPDDVNQVIAEFISR